MEKRKGYLQIAAASVLWGTMGIFGKLVFARGVGPTELTALRILISFSTVFVPMIFFKRELLKIEWKDLPQLIVFGVFAVALQRLAFFYTVDLTTPTIAAMLFYTYPIFVTVYSSIFLKEKATPSTLFAMILAFLGVALIVKFYEVSKFNVNMLGFAFGMLTSILFALYFLMAKKLRGRYTNWTLLVYGDGIGAVALLPALFHSSLKILSYPLQLWYLILVIAWLPSLTAYLLFSYALKYVKSAKGSILSLIEPLSAAVLSSTFLGETFEYLQLVGILLALVGILLLFCKPKPKS
jgi:drug/metabolite transporter (DMT)-like permease